MSERILGPEQVGVGHEARDDTGLRESGVGGGTAGFDPGRLMVEVDRGADRLEKAIGIVSKATGRFEAAEEAFEVEMAELRLRADLAHAESHDGKLPSQDRRQDVALTALRREKPQVYVEYFAAKTDKESAEKAARLLQAAVSARQSLLKFTGAAGG